MLGFFPKGVVLGYEQTLAFNRYSALVREKQAVALRNNGSIGSDLLGSEGFQSLVPVIVVIASAKIQFFSNSQH